MKIYYLCTYYSQWAHRNFSTAHPRTVGRVFNFCRAVKNRLINGTLTVPFAEGPEVIHGSSVVRAREIFGLFIINRLSHLKLDHPILIPIPSKDGLVEAHSFRSLRHAE